MYSRMNKNRVTFGKVFWPSLIAGIFICVIGAIIFSVVLGNWANSFNDLQNKKAVTILPNTVLHMQLNGEIGERSKKELNPVDFKMNETIGVADILSGFEWAASNENIKGVFMEIDGLSAGYSTLKEIRKAIDKFEKSGKFVIAYNAGEVITLKEYYLSSAANKVYGFPSSNMEFIGLGAETVFFKNMLRKLRIETEVIRGKNNDFKSAVEPFFRDRMSDSSEYQMEELLNNNWAEIKMDIATARKVKIEDLDLWADEFRIRDAEDAAELMLLDGVKYRDEIMAMLAKKSGNKMDKLEDRLVSFTKYCSEEAYENQLLTKNDNPSVAVVLAEGGISVDGDGMTSKDICKLLREARANESVKTVVFRVNSPGGSALASDAIWREVKLTDKVKPVIVSMGDVAASGGYYISAPATAIFAEANTITGSIGVFGVIPYTGRMFETKIGLNFDRVSTNKHEVMTTNRKLTREEKAITQEEVDKIYMQFMQRVADGRGMTVEEVNNIARGRVWSGIDAKKVGLVDEIGGLSEAIAYAAKLQKIKEPKVLYYPLKKKNKFEAILQAIKDEDEEAELPEVEQTAIPEILTESLKTIKTLEEWQGIQMRMPLVVHFK